MNFSRQTLVVPREKDVSFNNRNVGHARSLNSLTSHTIIRSCLQHYDSVKCVIKRCPAVVNII